MLCRRFFLLAMWAAAWHLGSVAWAASLGQVSGTLPLGRPLDLSIPATLDDAQGEEPCVAAEVVHGDVPIPANRVQARWQPRGEGSAGVVRVRSEVRIDEPYVTVTVRAGCRNPMTRRYVLLTELAPAPATAAPPPAQAAPTAPVRESTPSGVVQDARPSLATQSVQVSPRARPSQVEPSSSSGRLRSQPAPRTQTSPAPAGPQGSAGRERPVRQAAPAVPRAAPAQAASRLRLEPLDLSAPGELRLRASNTLGAQPGTGGMTPGQAAALWRALSAPAEESLRDAQRLQAMESELRTLQELSRNHAATLDMMRGQLEKARSERNLLAQVAVGLALLVLAGVVLLAWRNRQRAATGAPWWRAEAKHEVAEPRPQAPQRPAPQPAPPAAEPVAAPAVPARTRGARAGSALATGSRWATSGFGGLGGGRVLSAEELVDVQQQAEFFLSLGETAHAIELLENHLAQDDSGTLVWLDLLEIYHQQGRRQDYERIRAGFEERFHALLPAFEAYRARSGGLEAHPEALARIVQSWETQRSADVLDQLLVSAPQGPGERAFELEAYRELLLLYNIARDKQEDPGPAVAPHAKPAARLPVDIDLGDFVAAEPPSPGRLRPPPAEDPPFDFDLPDVPGSRR